MSNTQPFRGMRDFLPLEKARRDAILRKISEIYRFHGFVEIETPYLESLDHLTSSQGGDNEKMLFKVLKRGLSVQDLGGAPSPDELCDMGLRYDLTLPLARYYADNVGKIPEKFRVMQSGPVWRAERPQKGRYRQFTQCDIDIIGDSSALAEVELITVTVKALGALGLGDLTLKLNDRRLLAALLQHVEAPQEHWARSLVTVDKLDKIGVENVTEELATYLDAATVTRLADALRLFQAPGFSLAEFAEVVDQPEVISLTSTLRSVLDAVGEALPASDVTLRFDGALVRGMGYYSGPIFELWHRRSRGAIAGGGRYDGMIGRFLGRDVPACGFSIGFERITQLVTELDLAHPETTAIVYEAGAPWSGLVRLQDKFVTAGTRARLVERPKRVRPLLDALAAEGFDSWISVDSKGKPADARPLASD